jgi:hypothetical protein
MKDELKRNLILIAFLSSSNTENYLDFCIVMP